MTAAGEPAPGDAELEELVCACLEAADPRAELQRRTAGRPQLLAAAERLLAQVSRLERLDATALAGAPPLLPGPRADDPASWPVIPGVALTQLLGRGGQGFVFAGRQSYLDRPVAVKVLAPDLQTPAFVARFRREARLLASLQHEHIVACHDAGVTAAGECYLVMPLVDGPNLRRWLDQRGALPVPVALQLVRDLAAALAHAQQQGLVHRDVKPENVLLQPRAGAPADDPLPFVAKLADLGLARPAQRRDDATLLTPAGAVVGTPQTMAPEQFDAPDAVDHRADLYGLGCILHHALTGRPAFVGTAMTDLVVQKARLQGGAGLAMPGVEPAVAALVGRLLAWSPAARPQSYAELQRELDALLAAAAPPAGAVAAAPAPPARRGRRLAALGATGAALLAAALLWPDRTPALAVAAPAEATEGETVAIAWTPRAAAALQCTQTRGAPVLAPVAAAHELRFVVPYGAAGQPLGFAIGAAGSAPLARVELPVRRAAGRDPLAAGAVHDLFVAGADTPLAGWRSTAPQRWQVDELGRGALCNSPRERTAASRPLPAGEFALSGCIEPRHRYASPSEPKVPVAAVELRVLLAGHDALALRVGPAPGGGFQAQWLRQQRDGAGFRDRDELASCRGEFPAGAPLQFALRWRGDRAEVRCGPADAPDAARAEVAPGTAWAVPWPPGLLEVEVERGVAVFTDWRLAALR